MERVLSSLRVDVDTLVEAADEGRRPRITKTERLKAVEAIHNALGKHSTVTALTAASTLEMVRGPQEDAQGKLPPLGWAELISVMVETLNQTCHEALKSKSMAKSKKFNLKLEYMTCFRHVLKLSLANGPSGVIRPIAPAFLYFAAQWLSEPQLRMVLSDQIWQCVRDILHDDANRAMLTPPYIRTWVDICVEQLTGRGPITHSSSVVSKLAGEVLQTIARGVTNFDIHTQSTKSFAPSKMPGGEFGYAIICERCCFMLITSMSMSTRNARELQTVAFRTLTTALSDHALDVIGSNALKSVINISLKPILSCWTDRRYHNSAVALASLLIRLDPEHKGLSDICRQRILADMREESSSAVVRAGHQVKDHFIDVTAACVSFRESLQFAASSDAGQGQVIVWLRVAHAIISHRVLKLGTSLLVDSTDVMEQCTTAAESVASIFRTHKNNRRSHYLEVMKWSTRVVDIAAILANRIHTKIKTASAKAVEAWHKLYGVLQEQVAKVSYSVRSKGSGFRTNGETVHTDAYLLQTASLLGTLDILDASILSHNPQHAEVHGAVPYPFSKIASNGEMPSALVVENLRNVVARCGMRDKDGGHLRLRLIHSLVDICGRRLSSKDSFARMVLDGSSAAVALARGECAVRPCIGARKSKDGLGSDLAREFYSHSFDSFQSYFSQSTGRERICHNGDKLVERLRDQLLVFGNTTTAVRSIDAFRTTQRETLTCPEMFQALYSPARSAHFAVDSVLTQVAESQMLEKLIEIGETAELVCTDPSQDVADSGSDSGCRPAPKHIHQRGFRTQQSCNTGMGMMIFVGNYLLEGIKCGTISLNESDPSIDNRACEGMAELLAKLVSALASTEIGILVPSYDICQELIQILSGLHGQLRVVQSVIQADTRRSQKMRDLWEMLSKTLTSLSNNLCSWLMEITLTRTKAGIKKIQQYATGRLLDSESQKRLNSKRRRVSTDRLRAESSKRRRLSPGFSPSASEDSQQVDASGVEKASGFDSGAEDPDADSDGSSSDGEFMRISNKKTKRSDGSSGSDVYTLLQFHGATEMLCLLLNQIPDNSDSVLDICLKGMDADEEAERLLSPDGFERAALASSFVEGWYIELRESLWKILFTLKNSRALEALAKDVTKIGLRWKDLEKVSHSYDSFYVELLRITSNNRKTYPMPDFLEKMRISFLKHAGQFMEVCIVREESAHTTPGSIVQLPSVQTILFEAGNLIDVSEHFRLTHAFRMPRLTRIVYMRFGLAAIQLVNEKSGEAYAHLNSDVGEPSVLREATQFIQSAVCKLLADSEAIVRIIAARAVPKLLSTFCRRPVSHLETSLQDAVPQITTCQESKTFYGHSRRAEIVDDLDESSAALLFEMSDDERNACSSVSESFRNVGSRAKASAAFIFLGEMACLREDLIPFCIVQMLLRVMKGAGTLAASYHMLARLCFSRGYRSPRHLYQTFARLILPKWFKDSQGVKLLHKLPSALLVDSDHHSETILYDWMRDEQSNLVPHILVSDLVPSFPHTTEFANVLGVDLESLLLSNVGPFSLVFPMQFMRHLHAKGKELWEGIDGILGGRSKELMFRKKSDVMKYFLRNVSCGINSLDKWKDKGMVPEDELGFSRETMDVSPPFYDPLVVACAINQLFESETDVRIVPKSVLRGPLFSEVRDEQTGSIIADSFAAFIADCQKGKISLLRILLSVSRFLFGPPDPQPSQNRLDGFFCVGMLWRMLGVNILVKSSIERALFYRLLAKGFEQRETVHDAAWLLLEVQNKVITMELSFPDVQTTFSDLSMDPLKREHLLCLSTCQERQMYELLSAISPVLVSIASSNMSPFCDVLQRTACEALCKLLQLCHEQALWTVILCNGPLPNMKPLLESRRLYDSSKAMVEVDTADKGAGKLVSSLDRFQGIYSLRNSAHSTAALLACLQEISHLLTDSAVGVLSQKIYDEGWVRSDGQEQPTVLHISQSISCLINLVFETGVKLEKVSKVGATLSGLPADCNQKVAVQVLSKLFYEVGYVISVLGLLHPPSVIYIGSHSHNMSIPTLSENGRYEDVESGIERCLFLLVEVLRGPSAIGAETALLTLLDLLRSDDGKKVFLKEKNRLSVLHPIRSAARKLVGDETTSSAMCAQDPLTGEDITTSSFPKLFDAQLWAVKTDERDNIYRELYMRRLCFVLSRSCRSGALQTLSSACFLSYQLSCEVLPYFLMNIVSGLDSESLSKLSQLILHQVLLNPEVPAQTLRTFVHALDVLCQTGSDVIYQDGVSRWLEKKDGFQVLRFRYSLDITYMQAAKAALRSGSFFSAIRFAQMHVDQVVSSKDFGISGKGQRSERRQSSGSSRDPSLENAERMAKQDIADLVKEAMVRINENDGVRAFGDAQSLTKSVAGLSALDGDWARSLTSLDILGRRNVAIVPARTQQDVGTIAYHNQEDAQSIDMRRELSLMRSFIGLGTLSIATDYWDGLRTRASRVNSSALETVTNVGYSPRDELNDLRYALAWKLGQWESPPMLPDAKFKVIDRRQVNGFHESVYRVLRAFRLERWSEVSTVLAQSRGMELRNLVRDSAGASAMNIFQTSARLRLYQILEDIQRQNSSFSRITDMSSHFSSSIDVSLSGRGSRLVRRKADMDEQIGIPDSSRDVPDGNIIEKILEGFKRLEGDRGRGEISLYTDPFDDSIIAEDLPIALLHSLARKNDAVRAAAAVSLRILSGGGNGSWARAASSLWSISSTMVTETPEVNRVAWKLQECRLRWFASHDASLKKQALESVKDIISKDLGGCSAEKRSGTSSDVSSTQETLFWESDERNCEQYAYLRSEACIMAANWSLDMRTHEPISLFDTFLEAGLRAVESVDTNNLTGRAHFAMASFADAQIANIDSYRKTSKYEQMVSAIRESEEQIDKLQTINNDRKMNSKASSRRGSRSRLSQVSTSGITEKIGKDLDSFIREGQKKTSQDRGRLERMQKAYQKWQALACKHFAACLRDGSVHDLRAAFRMVAIWLDAGQMRDTISKTLAMEGKSRDNKLKLAVPCVKLLPLAPQLSSRLSTPGSFGNDLFQKALGGIIHQMAEEYPAYCLWQLLALSNSTRVGATQEKYSSLYRGDKDKKEAADVILTSLQAKLGNKVEQMRKVADAYIQLSEATNAQKKSSTLDIRGFNLLKLGELVHVPVPTMPLPLNGTLCSTRLPHISSFEKRAGVCSGLSKPLRVVCIGSDGKPYPQMVKGRDDLRGDAVMEQLFTILNSLLEKDTKASKRSLLVRTYRIIPLSPFSGIMQFVSNTMQFKDVLIEKGKPTASKTVRKSLHERYRPNDLKHESIANKAFEYKRPHERPQRVKFLRQVWQRIQPVFRFFFLEQWPDPKEWFSHQLAYSRSVAVMSIVGFILGLGDRHLSNILLDVVTGEVVHIDFGIAFEQGKLLPTPEQMPFRLTRDIVDGFGIAGVEGVFRRSGEVTLSIMRKHKDVLLTVVEVLLHDPMFNWDLAPEVVIREQLSLGGNGRDMFESDDISKSFDDSAADAVVRKVNKDIKGSSDAQRALNRISEKLDGLEGTERLAVEAHVARLIDEAQAFHVIAPVYPGWAPWI